MKKKIYLVTGAHHGSVVEAYSKLHAKIMFCKAYNGEKILSVKRREVMP